MGLKGLNHAAESFASGMYIYCAAENYESFYKNLMKLIVAIQIEETLNRKR